MNKKKSAFILLVVLLLQLSIPLGMAAYNGYIEHGLEHNAGVYKFPIRKMEVTVPFSIWLNIKIENINYDSRYCKVGADENGFALCEFVNRKPKGDYIKSVSEWKNDFEFPSEFRVYELEWQAIGYEENDKVDYWNFVRKENKEDWGMPSMVNAYYDNAYMVVRVFKGHIKVDGVFVDDLIIEEYIKQYKNTHDVNG